VDALEADPDLVSVVRDAGVDAVWISCFFQGTWHYPLETALAWQRRIEAAGMSVGNITVPLGHPSFTEGTPDYMPDTAFQPWQRGVGPDGRVRHGVCVHPGATEANVEGVRKLKTLGPTAIFLDDDFRLAPSPHDIGGCFCDAHREAFLRRHGHAESRWDELLEDVRQRRLTPILRAWVTDACDELTACFRAQQEAAAPETELGIMVMYLGCEKAGIRLRDYRDVPFRVGELMFNDESFAPVKGKTNELFSALFHRRFVEPGRAYSETTAWPPDQLSAANMAAKLVVSTIADVRNTMFMSGITPFPRTHWETLAPAMREQKRIHEVLAGHVPRGPFKHFWGEASRWVGDADPYSLFLATGVPFEVVDAPGADGWTFLADADAGAVVAGNLKGNGTTFVCRSSRGIPIDGATALAENLPDLFEFKRAIRANLGTVPIVEEDVPIVCAWYPTAKAALLWNLTETSQNVTLTCGESQRAIALGPVAAELVPLGNE